MSNSCIVCTNRDISSFYQGLNKCNECGFVFAELTISEEELLEIYHEAYFSGVEYVDYLGDRETYQKNFDNHLRKLKKFIEPSRHRHLFEIGCAYGFFLDIARDHFENVQGIDIVVDGIQHCKEKLGLDVLMGDLLEVDLGGGKIDVLCMWDTIEHLLRPHLYIQKISQQMERGALLALTTGDIESLNARVKKGRWRLIHPPTHIHYFSRRTIKEFLARLGFDVIYNRYCGFYRSLDFTLFSVLVAKYGRQSLYSAFKRTGLGKLSFYLNLYDIMYVVAQKR